MGCWWPPNRWSKGHGLNHLVILPFHEVTLNSPTRPPPSQPLSIPTRFARQNRPKPAKRSVPKHSPGPKKQWSCSVGEHKEIGHPKPIGPRIHGTDIFSTGTININKNEVYTWILREMDSLRIKTVTPPGKTNVTSENVVAGRCDFLYWNTAFLGDMKENAVVSSSPTNRGFVKFRRTRGH